MGHWVTPCANLLVDVRWIYDCLACFLMINEGLSFVVNMCTMDPDISGSKKNMTESNHHRVH
jgi:phage-related holin